MRNVTLQEAKAILSTPEETAEHLMIVHLIRHDLYSAIGLENFRTRPLMQIEKYSIVYQLVSVVKGTLLSDSINSNTHSDIDPGRRPAASASIC